LAVVTTRQLLEAGMHFGHQTRRWNPKMRRFILGERNGIYIIDLRKTLEGLEHAYSYVRDLVAGGGVMLFVGTKKQTQGPIATYARACGMPYVNERWLGGMLTNFATISSRVGKLREYEAMERAGDFDAMPKKEGLRHRRELEKLRRNLGGIADLDRLPDAIFVIDTKKEHIAVTEANKLKMPIVAVVDTNCDPDVISYVIPGNDDAIRSGALMCRVMAEAVVEGRWVSQHRDSAAGAPAPAAGAGTSTRPAPAAPAAARAGASAPATAAEPAAPATAAEPAAPATAAEPAAPEPASTPQGEESPALGAPSQPEPAEEEAGSTLSGARESVTGEAPPGPAQPSATGAGDAEAASGAPAQQQS
jgi:small subunit ribosomal protein S2